MSTTSDWIVKGLAGKETIHNVQLGLTVTDVNSMVDIMVTPPLSHIIFGDYSKWCSNLVYFPMNIKQTAATTYLTVGGSDTDVTCFNIPINATFGYTLGEYYYAGSNGDFTDYEPYSTLQIYLPFYGFVDIPIVEVIGKYIQFRLSVDFMTGQAMYTIGANPHSVYSPNAPYKIGTDDSETRIISTNVFQLGVSIPLGQTGMADTIRNILTSAIKGAATIGASAIGSSLGANVTTSKTTGGTVTKVTTYDRFGAGNRPLKTKGRVATTITTEPTTRTTDRSAYARGQRINESFSTATNALSNMALHPSIDKPNNTFVDIFGCRSIKIIRKTSKVLPTDEHYGRLYGYPLGETRLLSTLSGYTEVSSIHFEGDGFARATQGEIALLQDAFADGVIL